MKGLPLIAKLVVAMSVKPMPVCVAVS